MEYMMCDVCRLGISRQCAQLIVQARGRGLQPKILLDALAGVICALNAHRN
jgi:hypothetical protein